MVTAEVTPDPRGEEVPAPEGEGLKTDSSPGAEATPPRSMKRERSFFSSAWMSSGLASLASLSPVLALALACV